MALFKKKQVSENLEELRDITDDVIEADFVPFACHWNPHTIVTKNGEVVQIIKISLKKDKKNNPVEDVPLRDKIREATMTCIDSTQYAVWIHTIRRKENFKTQGYYKRDFAGYLNHYWNDKHDWEHRYVNEIYISIVKEGKTANGKDVWLKGMIPNYLLQAFEATLDEAAESLRRVTAKMLPILNEHYDATLLGVVKREDTYYSEACEFLDKLVSLRDNAFPLQDVDLSHQLTDYDVTFGANAMEVRMRVDEQRRFGAVLTLREYRELDTEALDIVLQIPAELVISQFFEFIPATIAKKSYQRQETIFKISQSPELAEKIGLTDIMKSDKGNLTDFGRHQLNLFILGDTVKSLEAGVGVAVRALARLGMAPIREDLALEDCYWSQLPANFEFIHRTNPINTRRIAGFANLTNAPTGMATGNQWGAAVTTLQTAARTSYFFNFHVGSNGHTLVISPPDAGKTVLINFLLSEARKFSNRIIYFDYNQTSEIFIRALGGSYFHPYLTTKTQAASLKLNPFSAEDTIENREFLTDWLLSFVERNYIEDMLGLVAQAVAATMQLPEEERSLLRCIAFIRAENPEMAELFLPWTEGKFASIFSTEPDNLDLSDEIYGFEMANIYRNPVTIVPVSMYLVHRINQSLDGRPCIIVMSEAWKLLDNAFFYHNLAGWLDDLRQKNTLLIAATEYANEIVNRPVTKLLSDKVATKLFLPDTDANQSYSELFGLSDQDVAYLQVMNEEDRHFMIKQDKDTVISELNLTGMNSILAVLDADDEQRELMEKAMEKKGEQPANWMPAFLNMI